MQVILNFEKRHFVFLIVFVSVLFVVGVSAYQSSYTPAVMGHSDNEIMNVSASKVLSGTFGSAFGGGNFGFPGNLNITNTLFFPGDGGHNGIFWGATRQATFPFIFYAVGSGLLISSGSDGYPILLMSDVTVNQNLNVLNNITTKNLNVTRNITLGGELRDSWPGTTVIAVHSQTSSVPDCPAGWDSLWTGYSLVSASVLLTSVYTADLGTSDSCVSEFRPGFLLECQMSGTCYYVSPQDYSDWLINVDNPPPPSITKDTNGISKCNVCEKVGAAVLVKHSQTTTTPTCPAGWKELWDGYSLALTTGYWGAAYTADQGLGSPGSCLPKFKRLPFTECSRLAVDVNTYDGCWYSSPVDLAGWVVAKDAYAAAATYSTENDARNVVSRCVVCEK